MPLVTEEVVRAHMEEMYGPLRDVCIRFHKYSESVRIDGVSMSLETLASRNALLHREFKVATAS